MFSMTIIERFLRGFSVLDIPAVVFLDLLKTLKTQQQTSLFLYMSYFPWESSVFLWFDFQTHGCTYQGGNRSNVELL